MPVLVSALNALQGPGAQIKEVGPQYDLLLATRDGSTLACKNKDGDVVNISKLAFMTSVSNQNQQHEETELQHKDNLVQLAGPSLIDREFDQWPQVSQGDWSGGIGQRVFTGATPITGGTESDPTRYWDGIGILWPVADYLPQAPVIASPDQPEGGNPVKQIGPGVVSGGLISLTSPGVVVPSAFAYLYQQVNAPKNSILVIQGDGVQRIVTNPPGQVAGSSSPLNNDMVFAFGFLWYAAIVAGQINLYTYDGANPPNQTLRTSAAAAGFVAPGTLCAGKIGNKSYVAIVYIGGPTTLQVWDVTASTFATTIPAQLDSGGIPPGLQSGYTWTCACFLGDNIVIGGTTGSECVMLQFNVPSQTWTTIARFPNADTVYFCVVAGSLFVVSGYTANLTAPGTVDMWLLQGSNLQSIGSVQIADPTTLQYSNFITGMLIPAAWGSYAIFGVNYFVPATGATRIAIFAYDALRGRLFRTSDIGNYSQFEGNSTSGGAPRMAILSAWNNHTISSGNITSQWAVLVPIVASLGSDTSNVQRLLVGVSNGGFSPLLQQGIQVVSSLIDFTSAQLKLFRQLLVTWAQPGLPTDSAITVRLDVWLDQDPANLNVTPDFTVTVAGGAATQGQTQLRLTINRIAHKLVYRVTTVGPSPALTPAVKLQSVVVRAATGWTRTMLLDLADNVMTNGKAPGTTAWSAQQPPGQPQLDAMVARDFLRQLWRQQGGEVVAVFPGFDPPANWLLQDVHWDSPKPFGVSVRSDQRNRLEYLAQVKMREDV